LNRDRVHSNVRSFKRIPIQRCAKCEGYIRPLSENQKACKCMQRLIDPAMPTTSLGFIALCEICNLKCEECICDSGKTQSFMPNVPVFATAYHGLSCEKRLQRYRAKPHLGPLPSIAEEIPIRILQRDPQRSKTKTPAEQFDEHYSKRHRPLLPISAVQPSEKKNVNTLIAESISKFKANRACAEFSPGRNVIRELLQWRPCVVVQACPDTSLVGAATRFRDPTHVEWVPDLTGSCQVHLNPLVLLH